MFSTFATCSNQCVMCNVYAFKCAVAIRNILVFGMKIDSALSLIKGGFKQEIETKTLEIPFEIVFISTEIYLFNSLLLLHER